MDRDVDVRTPESVAFSYQLAGLGSRFLAVLIDQILQIAVFLALFLGLAFGVSRVPPSATHAAASAGTSAEDKFAVALLVAIGIFIVFAIFFGYFIIFEALWNGQTPGKKALGIRVVRDGGYPVDFGSAMVRNIIRIGEFLLGYYVLSAISALISSENKRLGDFAAGTIVVRDERMELAPKLRVTRDEPVYASTAYLSGEERALVARFIERRGALDERRRAEIAASIAARVRDRVPPELAKLDDEALLERL